MGLVIYRYRTQGPAISDINRELPSAASFSAASSAFVDVQFESTQLQDLTDAMAARGWVLDSTAPGNTPNAQVATSIPPTFATVNAALAAANASIAVNNQKITSLLDPTSPQDAATKSYVDAASQGLDPKNAVVTIATTNITLSGEQTINGILTSASRVAVIGQSTASQNGIYTSSAGAWVRTNDADTSAKVTSGLYFLVTQGALSNTGWVLTTPDPIVLGTTALTFVQFNGAGSIIAGAGLTKTGNTIDVVANADGSIVVAADDIRVGVLATDAQHGIRGGGTLHAVVVAAGAAGFMSGADKAKLDGLASTPKNPQQVFGVAGIGTTTTARFLTPGYNTNQAPVVAPAFRLATGGNIKSLRVRAGTAGVGAANLTYTLMVNGVASALTVTGAATLQDMSSLVTTVAVAAGDLISVQVNKSATITTSPVDVLASIELAP